MIPITVLCAIFLVLGFALGAIAVKYLPDVEESAL